MFVYEISFKFFFQAEDGIRDSSTSRGLGDVYKRQLIDVTPRAKTAEINNVFNFFIYSPL